MKYAVYRIHYGLDFLEESVNNIINDVDLVFICWSTKPWLKNMQNLPPLNENVMDFVNQKFGTKVSCWIREFDKPLNQYKLIYDEVVSKHGVPKQALFMEPDMVWDTRELKKALELTDKEISFNQIEFWKNEHWYITRNKIRPGPTLYNGTIPETNKGCWSNIELVHPTIKCFNYGFCLNRETMLYKHDVAIKSSSYISDSIPNKEWYKDKWLNWTPETEDLEISEAHKHHIKKAEPYPYGT